MKILRYIIWSSAFLVIFKPNLNENNGFTGRTTFHTPVRIGSISKIWEQHFLLNSLQKSDFFHTPVQILALPISSDQTTNYGGLGYSDTAAISSGTVIDDISYDGWRYNGFGGETGIYPHESSITALESTTGTRFYTSDGSNFKFTSIDYLIDTFGSPATANITFYGYRNGSQVESQTFNSADTSSGTYTLNWDSVDEVKIAANTQWIFMDNLQVGAAITLPIELISFEANFVEDQIRLTWTTAYEAQNKGFRIQEKNEFDWQDIGFVKGQGNSSEQVSYEFLTSDTSSGSSLIYRLAQVDWNGSIHYSNQIEVFPERKLKAYPNPSSKNIWVDFGDEKTGVRLILTDLSGKQVYNYTHEKVKELEISLPSSKGIYFMTLIIPGETRQFVKLVKE